MNIYKIEHRVSTLAQCAVLEDPKGPATFEAEGVTFSHWSFNWSEGWLTDYWLAEESVEADNFNSALKVFSEKLIRLIPRIALISQSYTTFQNEPFIIHKIGTRECFFRNLWDTQAGGLMFMEGEREILVELLGNTIVPEEFYYYWNDAINTHGYSSKLLSMFAAIECLKRNRDKLVHPQDFDLYEAVLGHDLAHEVFEKNTGLRHRLSHGNYFNITDGTINYVDVIHQKVMQFFNTNLHTAKKIAEDVVAPQRHPFASKEGRNTFIRRKNKEDHFKLREILEDFEPNDHYNMKNYENFYDPALFKSY